MFMLNNQFLCKREAILSAPNCLFLWGENVRDLKKCSQLHAKLIPIINKRVCVRFA